MVAKLNPAQQEANRLLGSPATHILLRGGSRSGKTFLLIRALVIRAAKAPGTRHGIFRHRFNALKHSIIGDTFPKVMRLCFPDVPYNLNRTDWYVTLPNGSEILFHGLDSSDRTEKILGLEFATVYLNEASQIGYGARNMLLTRLAQKSDLRVKEYIDANPPTTSHWLYSLFERHVEPKSGEPLPDPADYATMQINPDSNRANLSPEYLKQLESLPEKERQRFLFGNYQTAIEG
ncbi:DNA packaging protein, partial [Komagataeibacter oboediens]